MTNDYLEGVYIFPASFGQQRMWFLDQFEPGSPFYNIPAAVRLIGALDYPAFSLAVNEVIRRHESLRTVFSVKDGQVVQVVNPEGSIDIPVTDLSSVSSIEKDTRARRLADIEARKPFDLAKGPLIRAVLVRLSENEHIVLFTMHHIISDGWSIGVLISELSALYAGYSQDFPISLPELPVQYGDYSIWQRDWLQGEVLDTQLRYWRSVLMSPLPVLELPTDRPRPAVQTSRGATVKRHFSKEVSHSLKLICQHQRTTMFMTLLAAFNILLYRYSNQVDICIGTPIANRQRTELENLIGLFINTLVLRNDLRGEPTFIEFLARVKETTLAAFEHQDLPFEQLVDELQPDRDMSHSALFQVMFILQNAPIRAHQLPGMSLEQIEIHSGTSTFDLTLVMVELPDGLDAAIEYNSDLFNETTIERMLLHFETLLMDISTSPTARIQRLALLSDRERQQVLLDWNESKIAEVKSGCVHHLFEQVATRFPERIAVVYPGDGRLSRKELTYFELNNRSDILARYLRDIGLGPDCIVGICLERGVDLLVAVLGVLKAGGAYLPLDISHPKDRLAFILDDSRADFIIVQEETDKVLPVTKAVKINISTDWQTIELGANRSSQKNFLVDSNNLVYLTYTSGSTGQSKGVMVEHASLYNAFLGWQSDYRLEEVTAHLQMANFSFDVFAGDWTRALCSGAKLVLCPREWLLSPQDLYSLLISEQIDCAEFVPAVLRYLVQYCEERGFNFAFFRLLACGSDSWYVSEYRRFLRLCGQNTRLINSFGLTEATIDSTYFEGETDFLSGEQLVPIGRAFMNTRLYVLDENYQPVPVGIPGELFIGGPGLARGYLNRPDLTAEKFIPNPFLIADSDSLSAPGMRLYRTGDKVRFLEHGNIEFLGRMDDQLKIRGYRIEPGEIEAVLGAHPKIKEIAIIPSETKPGNKELVAHYVTTHQASLTPGELRRYLQERLPDYMVPSVFLPIVSLPLNQSGKVDRRALSLLPIPDWLEREKSTEYVPARNQTEQMLVNIWKQILGVGQIGILDNFFEAGGHSLMATQLVLRVRQLFQVDLPLRKIFESPTIARLAEQIDIARNELSSSKIPPLKPLIRSFLTGVPENPPPLSFAQQRLWFLDQLEPNSPFYNLPESFRIKGPLKVSIFITCLQELVNRHESLRTTFNTIDGVPVQVITPVSELEPIKITEIDISHLPGAEKEDRALSLALHEAGLPFDLKTGPLFRTLIIRMAEHDHIVVITMHHIIGDNWSTNVAIQEVAVLYDAFSHDLPSPLPLPSIQYPDFSAWQREWLQGEILSDQINFWQKQLEDIPALINLPTDRPRPAVQTFAGDYVTFQLPEKISAGMHQISQDENVTLFMTLLGSFLVLLSIYTQESDLAVGTPIANRNRPEIENLIGFFVNTLVLRVDMSGNPTFREILVRVKEVALGAYSHQDIPFESIVDAVQPERNLSHSPLFQVMFALQSSVRSSRTLPASGLTISPVEIHSGTAKFDLSLFMVDDNGLISGALEFNTDLFDRETIQRMVGHFGILIEGIVVNPDYPIGRHRILSQDEFQRTVIDWNATDHTLPINSFAHQLFEAQVRATPDAIALKYADQSITYAELNHKSNLLARYLCSQGVIEDVVVAINLPRSIELVVCILGTLKAGGAYLPMDPTYPMDRLQYMQVNSNAPILITSSDLVERWETARQGANPLNILIIDKGWSAGIRQQESGNLELKIDEDVLAYVIYTSGSTGKPKGTLITHKGLANYLDWCKEAYPIGTGQGSPLHSSISFDLTITSLLTPLISGKTVAILPEGPGVEILGADLQNPRDYSLIKITPAHLQLLGDQLTAQQASEVSHAFIIGGENLTEEHISFWQSNAPDIQLVNEYGPTETVVGCCVYTVPPGQKITLPGASIPIGRPIFNTQLYILDQYLQPVPVGVPGELFIGGGGVARGYLGDPSLTAQRFIPNPFSNPDQPSHTLRLYRTGDRARYLRDGNIEYLGRMDFQVKIRGFRIELGEIESVLLQFPGIKECVVWIWSDPSLPSRNITRLVAYLVPEEDGTTLTENPNRLIEQIRDFASKFLPEYMIPSAFILLLDIPLTPNGKVDRKALPSPKAVGIKTDIIAPRSPVEEVIVGIIGHVLGIESISVWDNFFTIGGHSLLATQVLTRIRDSFQVDIPIRILFDTPTAAGLAQWVIQAQREKYGFVEPGIQKIPRDPDGLPIEAVPLSFSQQRLWFLDQLQPGTPLYNIPTAVKMTGDLDLAALEWSLNQIFIRHEILRTTIHTTEDGQAIQRVNRPVRLLLDVIDFSEWSESRLVERELINNDQELSRIIQPFIQEPFNLETGPLLRIMVIKINSTEHIFVINMHHIITDDWSLGIFLQELGVLYSLHQRTQAEDLDSIIVRDVLPPISIQYSDFSTWQRKWLQGDLLDQQLHYWLTKLADLPPVIDLPLDHPRPPVQTFNGGQIEFTLPASLTEKLIQLSRNHAATLFMTMQAAFQMLLYRYTGQEDIAIGTPIANRTKAEIENLMGFFVNTLVIRGDLSENPTFSDLLNRTRETSLEAYAHQDLPFEMLVDKIQPDREMSHSPLFQVMLILQNAPRSTVPLPSGLVIEPFTIADKIARYDLTLTLIEHGKVLSGLFEYNLDLFNAVTIQRLCHHFINLLELIVENPNQRIAKVNILDKKELDQLLVSWNATSLPRSEELSIHAAFRRQVKLTPESTALVMGNRSISYLELDERSDRIAHNLIEQGLQLGQVVSVCLDRSIEMVVSLLSILKAGGVYLPVDVSYPSERILFMLSDSGAFGVITEQRLKPWLVALLDEGFSGTSAIPEVLTVEELYTTGHSQTILPDELSNVSNLPAYMIYTSGSTGKPKGVLLAHQGLVNFIEDYVSTFELSSDDNVLQFASSSFDASLAEIFSALLSGAGLILADRETLLSPDQLTKLVQEQDISMAILPPTMLNILPVEGMEKLRILLSVGESCPIELAGRWSVDRQFYNGYGPTEATVGPTLYRVRNLGSEKSLGRSERSIPIGRPIRNNQLYILDTNLNPVPIGATGEIYIGGIGLAIGYHNYPTLTAEKFLPHPFVGVVPDVKGGERLYRTGDLGRYLNDGNIEFLGRIDDQVKVRGFRIEIREIERVLKTVPGIQECIVILREDTPGMVRLVAFYVSSPDHSVSVADIRTNLQGSLPDYMLPAGFIQLSEIPKLPNGKINRRALTKAPIMEFDRTQRDGAHVQPSTAIEIALAKIWADVLKIPDVEGKQGIGVEENFFELGGDSILTIQVVARANQLGVKITPRQIFENPTISALAKIFQVSTNRTGGAVRLSPNQLEIIHQLIDEEIFKNPVVVDVAHIKINQQIDLNILVKAINIVSERQDALRLHFEGEMINPLKISKGEIKPWDIEFEDSAEKIISVIDGVQENINAQLEQIKIEILTESGDRMRIAIVVRDTTITDLFILSHPIFFDTQSISLLITELFIAYSHAQGDDRLKVPFMTVTYSQFLTDLAEFYQSDRFEHSRQYWQVTDPIMSDLDGSRWNNKVLIVGKVPHRIIRNRMKLETWLSEDESSQLSKALSIYRTSFEEFMLTAVLSEFARFIDQERIFINIRRNMRHPDIRGLLGIDTGNIIGNLEFTFPILIDIGKDPLHIVGKIHPIGKMLISVKDQLLSVPDYGLGFSLLKYWGDQNQLENSNSNLLVPLISFQADQNQSPSFDMIGYQFYPGHVHSPITITATARDNKSGLLWDFDVNMVREGAIREIAENTIQQTKELISHCLSADAGGLSTSDLQVFGWSPDDLTDIISALNGE